MVLTITSRGKESSIYDNVWRQRAILGSLKSLNASESCFLFTELDCRDDVTIYDNNYSRQYK